MVVSDSYAPLHGRFAGPQAGEADPLGSAVGIGGYLGSFLGRSLNCFCGYRMSTSDP